MRFRERFVRRIAARFFVRFHMSLIFVATVAAAVVASRVLLEAGVDTLALRYALAVAAAYAVFFVYVRVWISYVSRAETSDPDLDLSGVWPGGGGSGGGHGAGFHGGGDLFSLDLDDAWPVVLALLVLVACLGGAAIWLVWQAPVILPEAAFNALLASHLVHAARRDAALGWARGVLKSTLIPFLLVLVAAALVGWAVHHVCPPARRLADVVHLCR
jgi:hypothetical protein